MGFVVPLFSWYSEEFSEQESRLKKYQFDSLCRWRHVDEEKVWRFFLEMNSVSFEIPFFGEILTFSHFLPRRSLVRIEDIAPGEMSAMGCAELDVQLRQLLPKAHVYGHSGRTMSVEQDSRA